MQAAKAAALVLAAPDGRDVTLINCDGAQCSWPVSIPATMIGCRAGERVKEKLQDSNSTQLLNISFQEQQVSRLRATTVLIITFH